LPPQNLEEFEGNEDDDDDDFLESQFAQDSMNQRKTPSNLDISEENFQNGILWTWWDTLGVRRQTDDDDGKSFWSVESWEFLKEEEGPNKTSTKN